MRPVPVVPMSAPQIVCFRQLHCRAWCGEISPGDFQGKAAASGLIAFGEANLLWNWRKPWLLNWKRGIRGLEYGSLYVSLSYMAELEQKLAVQSDSGVVPEGLGEERSGSAEKLEEKTLEFCALAKRLLFEEKIAAGIGTVSKLGKVSEKVDYLAQCPVWGKDELRRPVRGAFRPYRPHASGIDFIGPAGTVLRLRPRYMQTKLP